MPGNITKTSQMKAWGDPSSKAEFQSSKTLWRSKQTPVLELPKTRDSLLLLLPEKAAQKWWGTAEEWKFWNAGTGIKHPRSRGSWEVTQDQVRAEFQRNPEPAPPFPELFLSLTPGIAAPEMPPRAVFSNKVTLKQGKYKYVLGPFVSCHPKEPKDSFLTQLCKMMTKNQL